MTVGMRRVLLNAGLFLLCFAFHFHSSQDIFPQASIDAGFYHATAERFLQGQGLTEPYVWNHLKPNAEIIRPIDYWMPLGVILYSGAGWIGGTAGPILLNHLLWALLAIAVFHRTRTISRGDLTALTAFFFVAFAGKFVFYVSTTDNIVFYAWLGFLFFRSLDWDGTPETATRGAAWGGFISGLMALTRIEGLLFGFLATAFQLKRRQWRAAGVVVLLLLLTISPWVVRNLIVLGVPWPSNLQALFLRSYDDQFDPQAELSWAAYSQNGWRWIATHKAHGLLENLIEFFVIPGMIFLFPCWLIGSIRRWPQEGKKVVGVTLFFWLINGLLFTTQSVRGTAFHISAAFYPHVAILGAVGIQAGIDRLFRTYSATFRVLVFVGFMAYMVIFSLFATKITWESYEKDLRYYRSFFSRVSITPAGNVVSNAPWYVHRFSGCPGVVHQIGSADKAFTLAESRSCRLVLLDSRNYPPDLPWTSFAGWEQISIRLPLILWRKLP